MPGDKKHHTEKFRSCVDKVIGSGKAEDSAYAICTTSLQKAGEPIFEGAVSRSAEEFRLLDKDEHGYGSYPRGERGDKREPDETSVGLAKHEAVHQTKTVEDGEKVFYDIPVESKFVLGKGSKRSPELLGKKAKLTAKGWVVEHATKGDSKMTHFKSPYGLTRQKAEAEFKSAQATESELKTFVNAEESMRHLHLLGATGQPRTEMWNNREYLVVPCVSLMEGVIHAVNAATPEFVPFATLEKAAKTWDGKPVTLGHPKKNGKQCSADSLDVLEAHGIGVIRNSRVDAKSKKMLQEAWIEKSKVKKLHPEMLARLEANEHEEVSVGAFVVTDGKEGKHSNGREYKASWVEAAGDHLAFLPGGRGACSLEMGCGAHRAAMHLVCAEALEVVPLVPVMVLSTLEGQPLDDRLDAVNLAVNKKWSNELSLTSGSSAYAQRVFDDHVIVRKGADLWSVSYTVSASGEVAFVGEPTKVKQIYVAAEVRVAAGARNSAKDTQMIQEMHDSAVSLGAKCDRGNYETAAQKMKDCPVCDGNGSLKGNPCPACDGSGEVPMKHASSVRHEGGLWVLYSSNGSRRLGTHSTKEEAETQEQAIVRSLARQKVS